MEKSYEECMEEYEEALRQALQSGAVDCRYQYGIGLDSTLVTTRDGEFLALIPGQVSSKKLRERFLPQPDPRQIDLFS